MASPQTAPVGRFDGLKARLAARSRSRAASGRSGPSRIVVILTSSLLLLLVVVVLSAGYLFGSPDGKSVSVDTAEALASGSRVERAVLLDEDSAFVLHLRSLDEAVAIQNGSKTAPPAKVPGVSDKAITVYLSLPSNGSTTAKAQEVFKAAGAVVTNDHQSRKGKVHLFLFFFAPVLTLAEAPDHHHMAARQAFIEVDGLRQPAPAPRFSRTQSGVQATVAHATPQSVLDSWGAR